MRMVTTEFVRKHYAQGPTAYHEDGSVARMPTPTDVAYCEQQFDAWLAEHDREVRAAALAPIKTLAEKIMFDQDAEPARGAILAEIERQTSDDRRTP